MTIRQKSAPDAMMTVIIAISRTCALIAIFVLFVVNFSDAVRSCAKTKIVALVRMIMHTIRPSSLPDYNDCARRGATKIIRDMIVEQGFILRDLMPGVGMTIGIATHAGAAHTLNRKKDSGELIPFSEFYDVSMTKYEERLEKYGVEYDSTSPSTAKATQQIRGITWTYREQVAPQITPIEIEQPLVGKKPDYEVRGTPDTIEKGSIRDFKSGRERKWQSQLGSYSLLDRSRNGASPHKELIIDLIPRTKPDDYRQIKYNTYICELMADYTMQQIIRDIQKFIDMGSPWAFAANPNSMLCSAKYCQAWNTDWCEVMKG